MLVAALAVAGTMLASLTEAKGALVRSMHAPLSVLPQAFLFFRCPNFPKIGPNISTLNHSTNACSKFSSYLSTQHASHHQRLSLFVFDRPHGYLYMYMPIVFFIPFFSKIQSKFTCFHHFLTSRVLPFVVPIDGGVWLRT